MAKKTNKTSHVLNLITGGSTGAEEENQTSSPEQKVMVVDSSEDDRIADGIRNQLLDELGEKESGGEKQKVQETPALKQEEVQKTSDSKKEEAKQEEPALRDEQLIQEEPVLKEAQPEELPREAVEQELTSYRMVNVMEEILSDDVVMAEMKKYGVCLCSRCQADVRALLLTRLPAKYVVANVNAVSPLLSYYKNKFRVNILTQTIKACMDVKEHPRHE